MRFTKVKRNPKTGEIVLAWEQKLANGDVIASSVTSYEDPRPEFVDAMQALRVHVLEVCELPPGYATDLVVTGVSLNYHDEQGRGLVVTAQKKVTKAAAPVVINTPFVPEASEHGASLRARVIEELDTLVEEARLFQQGERAQQALALGGKAA